MRHFIWRCADSLEQGFVQWRLAWKNEHNGHTLCMVIHVQRNDTCPTVISRNCVRVEQVLTESWFGYKVQQQQIYRTVEQFSTNQTLGDILYPDWSKIVRCDVSSKDWCDWTLYLQNPTPVLFQGYFCASNQRQWFERFVWEDAWYIRLQVHHNEKVGSTEGSILTMMINGRRFLHIWSVAAFQTELFQGN